MNKNMTSEKCLGATEGLQCNLHFRVKSAVKKLPTNDSVSMRRQSKPRREGLWFNMRHFATSLKLSTPHG